MNDENRNYRLNIRATDQEWEIVTAMIEELYSQTGLLKGRITLQSLMFGLEDRLAELEEREVMRDTGTE